MTKDSSNRHTAAPDEGELLSCLVDGELDAPSRDAWLARLAQDQSACQEWTLLHLAGDALRSSEVACWHSGGFAARVTSVIADEPTVLAPAFAARSRRLMQRVVLPGVAVAAAAAVLAVLVIPVLRGQGAAADFQVTATKGTGAAPVVATSASSQALERSAQMEAYLDAHREVSGSGMMPPSAPLLRASTTLDDQGR